ncbi:MAG: hypothetical protein HN386_04580 [Candidatus Marinimicrobia bacterium]|nr:hypothetical protein [Candidatus Neomarinimicrobiota bacterium]
MELDSHLLGSQKVRLSKILEIKAHILDKVDYLIREGMDEKEATEKAIRSMEHPLSFATAENETQFFSFLRTALFFGIFMTVFRFVFDKADPNPMNASMINSLFYALFVGAWLSLFFNYYFTSNPIDQKSHNAFHFKVGHSLLNQMSSFFLGMIYLSLTCEIILSKIGLIENNYFKPNLYAFIIVLILLPLLRLFLIESNKSIVVRKKSFELRSWLTKNRKIAFKDLLAVNVRSKWLSFLPIFGEQKLSREIIYQDKAGQTKSFFIDRSSNLPNATRFIMMAEKAVKENQTAS